MNPVKPVAKDWLPNLSTRLAESFQVQERGSADFYSPDILEWKYFLPRTRQDGVRGLGLGDAHNITTFIGNLYTEFCSTDPNFKPVPALHTIDWFSTPSAGPAATMLYVQALKGAPVTYALGCSDLARRILLGFKFVELSYVPLFHSVINPLNGAVWRELHGSQPLHRKIALWALDSLQTLRPRSSGGDLALRPVDSFGDEVNEVIKNSRSHFTFTSRDPQLLNYFLAHPRKIMSGWHFYLGEKLRGFAITSCFAKPGLRVGKIVDCFLDASDTDLWGGALGLLKHELYKQSADVVSCYGSTPWVQAGLREAGFFRRGRTCLYLRDPEKRIPLDVPMHIMHIEGDASWL